MDIQKLNEVGRIVETEADEYIFYQGERGRNAYFILKGSVAVLVSAKGDGSLLKLTELKEGTIFGEMALLDDRERSATVRTLEKCTILVIEKYSFDKIVQDDPKVAISLLYIMAERLNNLYGKVEVKGVPKKGVGSIGTINAMMIPVTVEKGEKLYYYGEFGDSIAYILEGNVKVVDPELSPSRKDVILGADSIVGFGNLIFEGRRHETIEVIEKTKLIVVNKSLLSEFFESYSTVLGTLIEAYSCEIRYYNTVLTEQETLAESLESKLSEDAKKVVFKNTLTGLKERHLIKNNVLEFLSKRKVECPICGEKFEGFTIRYSKLKPKVISRDFRELYEELDELWYNIWKCPTCNYHNYNYDFFNLTNIEKTTLQKALLNEQHNFRVVPNIKENMNQVVDEYYNLLLCKKIAKSSTLRRAKVWNQLAWIYDDMNEQKRRNEAYRKARSLYCEDLDEMTVTLSIEEKQKLYMLIAELFLRDAEMEEAKKYLLKTANRKGNKAYNKQAKERLRDIKESLEYE